MHTTSPLYALSGHIRNGLYFLLFLSSLPILVLIFYISHPPEGNRMLTPVWLEVKGISDLGAIPQPPSVS